MEPWVPAGRRELTEIFMSHPSAGCMGLYKKSFPRLTGSASVVTWLKCKEPPKGGSA
jgi:hypothetical protein